MKTCESYEMHISALFDGEAERQDVIAVMEHLPTCSSCQGFFQGARGLQELADAQPLSGEVIEQLEIGAGSQSLEPPAPSNSSEAVVRRFPVQPRWAWGIAAALLLAVALWVRPGVIPNSAPESLGADEVTIEPNTGSMNEDRFVEMAVELLESDERYQSEMLGILMRFERSRVIEEGSTELAANRGESMMSWDLGLEGVDEEFGTEGDMQIGIY